MMETLFVFCGVILGLVVMGLFIWMAIADECYPLLIFPVVGIFFFLSVGWMWGEQIEKETENNAQTTVQQSGNQITVYEQSGKPVAQYFGEVFVSYDANGNIKIEHAGRMHTYKDCYVEAVG